MAKTLAQMTAELRAINVEKGWRPAEGGPGTNTWGDYVALLHSEISEALEAFRDHGLADATRPYDSMDSDTHEVFPAKPEGVGSELADVLIRLLDMCDVFGIPAFDADVELADVAPDKPVHAQPAERSVTSFGDHMAWLHSRTSVLWLKHKHHLGAPAMLRALVGVCETFGIDLTAEYERKVAFNRTRSFQHGGRTLSK